MTQREAAEKIGVTARWVRNFVKRMKDIERAAQASASLMRAIGIGTVDGIGGDGSGVSFSIG
jgi:hypothetical protein